MSCVQGIARWQIRSSLSGWKPRLRRASALVGRLDKFTSEVRGLGGRVLARSVGTTRKRSTPARSGGKEAEAEMSAGSTTTSRYFSSPLRLGVMGLGRLSVSYTRDTRRSASPGPGDVSPAKLRSAVSQRKREGARPGEARARQPTTNRVLSLAIRRHRPLLA